MFPFCKNSFRTGYTNLEIKFVGSQCLPVKENYLKKLKPKYENKLVQRRAITVEFKVEILFI